MGLIDLQIVAIHLKVCHIYNWIWLKRNVNLTIVYCKYFCKCHNVPPVKQEYDNKKLKNKTNAMCVLQVQWLNSEFSEAF
jgi:hypothetical protein